MRVLSLILIVALLGTLIGGCARIGIIGISRFHRTSEGGVRPDCPDFEFAGKSFQYKSVIDTNAVYWNSETHAFGRDYSLYRFFGNGRVSYLGADFVLSDDVEVAKLRLFQQADRLDAHSIGYYRFTDSSRIELELFGSADGGSYYKVEALVYSDRIVIGNIDEGRGAHYDRETVSVSGGVLPALKSRPDW